MNRVTNTLEFIEKSKEKYPGRFTYEKTQYTKSLEPITITCVRHGDFTISQAGGHINKRSNGGCPECAKEIMGSTGEAYKRRKASEFVGRAKAIHGDKYNYSNVVYKGADSKVKIICNKHGEFLQTPSQHLTGSGCPKCAREGHGGGYNITHAERYKDEWLQRRAKVYIIKIKSNDSASIKEEFYKVGITTLEINRRFRNTLSPYKYEIVEVIETNLYNAIYLESYYLKALSEYTYRPEHTFDGYTECFSNIEPIM